jgi:hypothetical protein
MTEFAICMPKEAAIVVGAKSKDYAAPGNRMQQEPL